ncbi:MAG TPA: hypothetical protein VFK45_07580 [Gammaproteobacteria bacterium]|nr:hypothetical protein [Gammaproteobacteria bacterium]
MPAEAKSLGAARGHVGDNFTVAGASVTICGMGQRRATAAADRLVARGAGALLSWGTAGGLASTLRPGDIMIPDRISTGEGETFAADAGWMSCATSELASRAPVTSGVLWSSRLPVASVDDKHALAEQGMTAVDMESGAVAAVAARAGIPFMAIKAICDPAERALPAALLGLVDAEGRFRVQGLPGLVLGGPAAWGAASRLRRDFAAALQTLDAAASALPAIGRYTVASYD